MDVNGESQHSIRGSQKKKGEAQQSAVMSSLKRVLAREKRKKKTRNLGGRKLGTKNRFIKEHSHEQRATPKNSPRPNKKKASGTEWGMGVLKRNKKEKKNGQQRIIVLIVHLGGKRD